jgi:aryl-alcohol dehydrogenase-like predicted oxidoreductase
MELRTFGTTGVRVSPLCLGAMMFGQWGNPDHDESIRIIHAALDGGINFIDTADVYSRGESEEIVGKALKGRRDNVIVATKVHGTMGDDPNEFGNSRRWIIKEVENSLRRLQTDWIDLYQIHRPEADTAIDETLGALTDLVRQGKVRYIGSSTFPAAQIVEAQWVAERRNRERFDLSVPENQRKLDAVEQLAQLADEIGISLIHLALAFVIRHPAVTAAIIGPRTMEQLESQMGAADVELSDDVLDRIDLIVPPGTTISPVDQGWTNPALQPDQLRR